MTRSDLLHAALVAEGQSPIRATAIVDRLVALAKRKATKTSSKVPRIDRDRKPIRAARKQMRTAVTKFLSGAAGDMAEQIVALRTKLGKADDPPAADVNLVLEALDFSKWDDLRAHLEPILIGVTQSGLGVAFDQIGFSPDNDLTDQVNEKAVDWAKSRSAELVGMSYDDDGNLIPNPDPDMAITESTRDMLRGSVSDAIAEGLSVADLTDQLEEAYAFSGARAETIAQFEIAQADVQGNMIAYKDSGAVSGKSWLLGSEHDEEDECDECAAMGTVPIDDDWDGNGDPPLHVGCVCDVEPQLAEDDEED